MDHLCFSLEGQRYTLELRYVHTVLPSLWISPLLNCPGVVMGLINFHGRVLPVVNLRKRLNLPEKSVDLTDKFIWASVDGWDLVLIADQVEGIVSVEDKNLMDSTALPVAPTTLKGIVAMPDGILLIQNLAAVLDLKERETLSHALDQLSA